MYLIDKYPKRLGTAASSSTPRRAVFRRDGLPGGRSRRRVILEREALLNGKKRHAVRPIGRGEAPFDRIRTARRTSGARQRETQAEVPGPESNSTPRPEVNLDSKSKSEV